MKEMQGLWFIAKIILNTSFVLKKKLFVKIFCKISDKNNCNNTIEFWAECGVIRTLKTEKKYNQLVFEDLTCGCLFCICCNFLQVVYSIYLLYLRIWKWGVFLKCTPSTCNIYVN